MTKQAARFPGWRHMTAVERRNARMHAMFDYARRPYVCGDGKRFNTLGEAIAHAGRVWAKTGNFISVENRA